MKRDLVILLFFTSFTVNAQNYIRLPEASGHIGETVRVSGRVFDTLLSLDGENNSRLLMMGNDCPGQTLLIAITEETRKTMNSKPEDRLTRKRIWVAGKLEEVAGQIRLVISNQNDIEIIDQDYDKIFTKVEQPPSYPGGVNRWLSFLNDNLDKTVTGKGPHSGKQTVRIQFRIDPEGNISDVQALEVPRECPGCGPEAVRVVKKSERWIPALQNCQKVTYQAVETIYFD
jgi:hypothetical protein